MALPSSKPAPAEIRLLSRKIAVLVARQKTTAEIAQTLEISEDRVRSLKKSPLFQEMVALIEERIMDEGVSDVVSQLTEDAPTNFSFIRNVRDGQVPDDPKMLGVRLRAATYLGDKTVPNAANPENMEKAVSLVLSAGLLGQMVRGFKNDGGAVEGIVVEQIEDRTLPKSSEEFIRRYIVSEEQRRAAEEDE